MPAVISPKKILHPGIPDPCCTLNISGKQQQRLLKMIKALSNPHRFEVMKFLLTHPGCITGRIVEHLPLSQATVSVHLKVLREAGWIRGDVSGPAVNYCLDAGNIEWFKQKIGDIF
jgi:ArsR family transcriptional regulator